MFGVHDENEAGTVDNNAPAQPAPQDDTLNGVNDLADGGPAPHQANPAYDSNSFMSTPTPSPQDTPVADEPQNDMPPPVAPTSAPASDDLLDLKQQALQQLSPLVGHLDQSPEEKFRTTMMLIQASDNQSLLKDAYDAAQQITDEKVRAQALLDVINEINYFTQKPQSESEA